MTHDPRDAFENWLAALEERHLREMTFSEVRRSLQALSSLYVERRGRRLTSGGPLDSAGKRAAFALFYGPLHFLAVRQVVRALGAGDPAPSRIVDLGCGTGASGVAWALEAGARSALEGVDIHPWAVEEARWTYRKLGLAGRAERQALERARMPGRREAVLAAFTINELEEGVREKLLRRLLHASRRGAGVLVIEPVSRRAAPWWEEWSRSFVAAGGRADRWRFPARLPQRLRLLDRAAGLDHSVLTARSLWLAK